MSSKKSIRLILAFAAIVVLLIPCVYVIALMRSFASFSDAYASDWTSIFVIEHLRTSGDWPRSWDDLRDEYDRLAPASHYAWTFDELQTRVWFDWKADCDEVRKADPPQKVFRLTNGRQISFNGDPNDLIREYLRTGNDPWRVDPPIGPHGGAEQAHATPVENGKQQ
ncbi:MAG: hypothetical protein JNM43_23350 [Planctomycetaceae bacterium]|nr:hypothetical protein [Planctomycetaceae bacterium]